MGCNQRRREQCSLQDMRGTEWSATQMRGILKGREDNSSFRRIDQVEG